EDGYVPKSYNTIADFTGLEYDTVRRCVDRLIKKGLLQKESGNKENKNIPYYLPVLESSVFINLAKEKLVDKRNARDEKNKNQAERLIPQIIETLEKDQYVLVALGLIKSSHESNPPEEKENVNNIYEKEVRYEEEERQRKSQLKKCISWNDL